MPTAAEEVANRAKSYAKGKSPTGAAAAVRSKPQVPSEPAQDALPPVLPGETSEKVVINAVADLYLYDEATGLFMNQQKDAEAHVVEAGRFLYWLTIRGPDRRWLSQPVDAEMNMNFALENLSAVWNYFHTAPSATGDGLPQRDCYSWLLRFYKREDYEAFQKAFSRCIWETLNEESAGKMKSDDERYLQQAYEQDVEMTSVEDLDAQEREEAEAALTRRADRNATAYEDGYAAYGDADEPLEGVPEEDEELDEEEADRQLGDAPRGMPALQGQEATEKDRNSQLAVGYRNDRTFVVRGNRIGVFKTNDEDKLEFATTIEKVATPKGKQFNPSKAMLHNEDSAMVLMDPTNHHSLFKMDLEYGKIVEEWKVHDDVQVQNVLPQSKYAQMSAEQTLIGTSHNGVYRIDPRLAGQKLVDSQFKQYATKADFSAAATDKEGRLAVASKKGDIRLFDQIGKNAKTALPALGDPILGVDVTADGRYIVATCKTYLLLIDTLIGDGKYKGSVSCPVSFCPRCSDFLTIFSHHTAWL